jgi:hypothetical protein
MHGRPLRKHTQLPKMSETKATEPAREVDAVAVEEVKPVVAS